MSLRMSSAVRSNSRNNSRGVSNEATYLRDQLAKVNDDLTSAFDLELARLKAEERELQEAWRLKTRLDLLNTLDKELQMGDLSEQDGLATRADILSLTTSGGINLDGTSRSQLPLDEMIQLSDESLLKSAALLEQLEKRKALNESLSKSHIKSEKKECEICEYPETTTTTTNSRSNVDTSEFLRKTVYSNLDANTRRRSSLGYYTNPELVRPNVLFPRSTTQQSHRKSSARVKLEMRPRNQNLNDQQTLTYDQRFGLAKSLDANGARLENNAKNNNNNNRTRPLASSVTFGGLNDSTNQVFDRLSSTNHVRSYIRLPVHRTLIHDKAWSPGKVNTVYYPNRDYKLSRNS